MAVHDALARRRRMLKLAATASVVFGVIAASTKRVGESRKSEATAIGTLRAVTSAEIAYASVNGGYFDTPACLARPSCVPGVESALPFMGPPTALFADHMGYRFEFHHGPQPGPAAARGRSASSMTRFAVVAMPLQAGRTFCVDDRQSIYIVPEHTSPVVQDGRCAETATLLQ